MGGKSIVCALLRGARDNGTIQIITCIFKRALLSRALDYLRGRANIECYYPNTRRVFCWGNKMHYYYNTVSADLFGPQNIAYIQAQVRTSLGGRVQPSVQVVMNVLDNVARNYRPRTGDIVSRYIQGGHGINGAQEINRTAIAIIVNAIRDEEEQQQINASLSVWPRDDVRAHGPLKLKRNDYMKGLFVMNY